MNKRTCAGLIKFFRDEQHLDELLAGTLYCNTPEFYRHSTLEGVSDPHESCSHAYRASRGDGRVKASFNGKEIDGITEVTIYVGGRKDMWLHCWCALDIPDDEAEFLALAADLRRTREQFGKHYAFIPKSRLTAFASTLRSLAAGREFDHGRVSYSDDQRSWSVGCKAIKYGYQREYRFLIGECGHTMKMPLILHHAPGFAEFIHKSPSIKMRDKPTGLVCRIDTDAITATGSGLLPDTAIGLGR